MPRLPFIFYDNIKKMTLFLSVNDLIPMSLLGYYYIIVLSSKNQPYFRKFEYIFLKIVNLSKRKKEAKTLLRFSLFSSIYFPANSVMESIGVLTASRARLTASSSGAS